MIFMNKFDGEIYELEFGSYSCGYLLCRFSGQSTFLEIPYWYDMSGIGKHLEFIGFL